MTGSRIPAPDLVRGFAVIGILMVNIGGFAGPVAATLSPHLPRPGTFADEAWFAFMLLLFEGKMRALLSIVFGASMQLAAQQGDAEGQNGDSLQLRRLCWLGVFGYLHWLLWWGDILFTYAIAGMAALAFRHASPRMLAIGAVGLFAAWHLAMAPDGMRAARIEDAVLNGRAGAGETAAYREERRADMIETAREMTGTQAGFLEQAAARLRDDPGKPLRGALATMGESMPLMLLGMALCGSGFFAGLWQQKTLCRVAIGGIAGGASLTTGFLAFAWQHHFPPVLMVQGLASLLAIPHLLMALGYAAILMLVTPRLAATMLGRRLTDAGRMALSNYVGTTLVMTFCFYGWGLGLMGQVAPHRHGLFVLAGWALMLGASGAWLSRFRLGPLEWLWRSLTMWELQPLRRWVPGAERPGTAS